MQLIFMQRALQLAFFEIINPHMLIFSVCESSPVYSAVHTIECSLCGCGGVCVGGGRHVYMWCVCGGVWGVWGVWMYVCTEVI